MIVLKRLRLKKSMLITTIFGKKNRKLNKIQTKFNRHAIHKTRQ